MRVQGKGLLAKAASLHERALRIQDAHSAGSLAVATTLNNIALLYKTLGRVPEAARYFERALAIQRVRAPESMQMARTVSNVGEVLLARGRPAKVRRCVPFVRHPRVAGTRWQTMHTVCVRWLAQVLAATCAGHAVQWPHAYHHCGRTVVG